MSNSSNEDNIAWSKLFNFVSSVNKYDDWLAISIEMLIGFIDIIKWNPNNKKELLKKFLINYQYRVLQNNNWSCKDPSWTPKIENKYSEDELAEAFFKASTESLWSPIYWWENWIVSSMIDVCKSIMKEEEMMWIWVLDLIKAKDCRIFGSLEWILSQDKIDIVKKIIEQHYSNPEPSDEEIENYF